MSDILDEPIQAHRKSRYTELAYEKCKTATIYFVLGILIGILLNMIYIPSHIVGIITSIFFILATIYGGLGFEKSLKSIHYKETDTIKKWLGCFVNISCILIIFLMFLMNLLTFFEVFGF